MCAFDCPVLVVDDFVEEGCVVCVGVGDVGENGADLCLVGVDYVRGIGLGAVAVNCWAWLGEDLLGAEGFVEEKADEEVKSVFRQHIM